MTKQTDRQPLDLEPIEARTAAATPGPWRLCDDYSDVLNPDGYHLASYAAPANGEFIAHARTDVPALLAEIRHLRTQLATFTTLADHWHQMADQGDMAIGCFEGPAAATLVAEVGERGRTYRKAAEDVRGVASTGRIPRDLVTNDDLADPATP